MGGVRPPGDPAASKEALHWFGMRRRGPPTRPAHLAAHPDPGVRREVVRAVARRSTPGVDGLLDALADAPHPSVREAVQDVRETL